MHSPQISDRSNTRILHLEDSSADAELVRSALESEIDCEIRHVQERAEFERALVQNGFDVVLLDYDIAGYAGLAALERAKALIPEVPVIMVSGALAEDQGIECLKCGAVDFVSKDRLSRLGKCVCRALAVGAERRERLKIEKSLRASEERFRALFEFAPDAIVMADDDGRLALANQQAERMFGYSRSELIGQPVELLLPDSLRGQHGALRQQYLAHAVPRAMGAGHTNLQGRRKDGSVFPVDISLSPIEVEGRKLVVAAIRDITAQKRGEAEHARLASLVENSADLIGLATPDGQILFMNESGRRMVGLKDEADAKSRNVFEFFAPEDIELFRTEIFPTVCAGRRWTGESCVRHFQTGERIPMEGNCFCICDAVTGEPQVLATVSRNISERKVAERKLQQFKTLVNTLNDPVYLLSPAEGYRFRYVNAAACRHFGFREAELLTKSIADIDPNYTAKELDALWRAIKERKKLSIETQHRRATGEIVPVLVSCNYLELENEEYAGGFIQDITERKEAETALRLSEANLNRAQTVGHIGSWHLDIKQNILTWSDETYRIFGVPAGTPLTYEKFLACIHPDDLAAVDASWQAAVRGAPYDIEHRIVVDGTVKWIRERAELEFDPQGQLMGGIGTSQDISERKQAEMRDAEHLHRMERLSELSMMLAGDPDVVFQRVVSIIGELFGVRVACLSQIIGTDLVFRAVYVDGKIFPNCGRCPVAVTPCATVLEDKAMKAYDHVQERFPQATFLREHEAYSYFGFPALDTEGRVVAVTCLLDDKPRPLLNEEEQNLLRVIGQRIALEIERANAAAERAKAEVALAESERFARASLDSLSARVAILDEQGVILATNRKWNEFVTQGQLSQAGMNVGGNYFSMATCQEKECCLESGEVEQGIRDVIAGRRKDFAMEYECHSPAEKRWFACRVTRFVGEGPVRVVVAHEDITQVKLLELQQHREERLESLGRLAGGIAHDLNNALAPILLSLELFRLQSPKNSDLLDAVETSAQHAAQMVRQLLTFAKGAEGNRAPVDFNRLARDLQMMMEATFPKNIRIEIRCANDLAPVLGDLTQLHQVLLNLCVNSRDAMPNGGRLAVQFQNREFDLLSQASIPEARPGRYVVITVGDTGAGIPPELVERIFEPFFTTKDSEKGTGLGLATVRSIIKGHGGFIQVSSEIGKGTRFAVHLPVEDVESVAATPAETEENLRGHGEMILVVEDEPSVRCTEKMVLEKLNYVPVIAGDGAEALMLAVKYKEELCAVLTDLEMPHMNGLMFLRSLRRLLPNIPVAVTSGQPMTSLNQSFEETKVAASLSKPFTEGQLAKTLKDLLGSA